MTRHQAKQHAPNARAVLAWAAPLSAARFADRFTARSTVLAAALATALLAAPIAHAQSAPAGPGAAALHRYPGADLALGEKLVREHKCTECHVRKLGGDGSAIYRPKGRINSPAALATMVEMCNTELNLGMFPEDVLSVAAVLQRDHYRFAARP